MRLTVNNLCKQFADKVVLEDISFNCESGVATGLLGRNGVGKTTTVRTILGIISKDAGEIFIDGKQFPSYYNGVGYLPEERGLYPKVPVGEQHAYFAKLRGLSSAATKISMKYWLERLEMAEYEKKNFETLSKGNQQKAQLIVALIHDPAIVILDEPFSGLDPVNSKILKDIVSELVKSGKIVIFSSHQLNYVEEFCHNIVLIHDKHIILQGELTQIKRGFDRKRLFVKLRRNDHDISDKLKTDGVLTVERINGGFMLGLESEDISYSVLQQLVHNQYDIDRFELVEHSLNDIFLTKVGETA